MDVRPKGRVSPYAKANVARRFIAAAIDGLLVATCLVFFVAIPFEALTIVRDPQGQRLGDRLAQTQVVEGLGARELIKSVQKELLAIQPLRKPAEEPVEVE